MKILLACPPSARDKAMRYSSSPAYIGYELTAHGRLVRRGIPQNLRMGYMVLCSAPACSGDPSLAAQEVLREINTRHYSGLIADFEDEQNAFLTRTLFNVRKSSATEIYAPESYAEKVPNSTTLASSFVMGGSLENLLENISQRVSGKLALQIVRQSEDYELPYTIGAYRHLEWKEREDLMIATRSQSFYSNQLCTYYFTYLDGEHKAHFVLYDTAASLKRKIGIADKLGIQSVLLTLPEVEELLPEILE